LQPIAVGELPHQDAANQVRRYFWGRASEPFGFYDFRRAG
jgi:hypothetical protein